MAKKVSKTCRTCLSNNVELLSIYNGDDNSVVEMLEYILDRQLEVTDGLPQNVCHECFNDISRCYSFKMKCNNSFEILRDQLDKRKDLPEVVMQIKVEPEVNITEEFFPKENTSQKTLDASRQDLTIVEMGTISFKSEPTEVVSESDLNGITVNTQQKNNCVGKLNRNQMQLYEKEILPPTSTITASVNQVDQDPYEHFQEQNNAIDIHTVQYLIRELKEERDSVDQLLEVEVNIRHCASCGAGFAHYTDFKEHVKNCKQKKQLNVIQRTQNKNKHLCPYCDKAFPRPCRLKNHLRKHPEEMLASKLKEAIKSPNKYMCKHCDLSFNLESSLKYHLSSHIKETQFNRSFCEKSLKKKLNLNRHLTNNTDTKKHKCKECYQDFELSSQLKIHMLEHKVKNSYVCRLCQKQFIHEDELKLHSLHVHVHNDEKPFKCKFCATGFSAKYNLIYHQRKNICKGK